jgi:hypothetical protein
MHYIRQDVWNFVFNEFTRLAGKFMYEKIPNDKIASLFEHRQTALSKLRLIPKSSGLRPITNLSLKWTKQVPQTFEMIEININ